MLPERLAQVVANAYLVCRLADTIEDDVQLDQDRKLEFHQRLVAIVRGKESAEAFATELLPLLSSRTSANERELVAGTASLVRVMETFSVTERLARTRCGGTMCAGMPKFQRRKSLRGFKNLEEMNDYCYVVAGVVGEMLTELFCAHCSKLQPLREEMMHLAVSFGQGLQMTNILKDIWDDRQANTCWLPRSVFRGNDFDIERLDEFHDSDSFRVGLQELIGIAHHHLRSALEYTSFIPPKESGIRKFCLRAIGLAILTLRKIHSRPGFTNSQRVRISRRSVRATIFVTDVTLSSDRALRMLFSLAAKGLPLH